MATDEADEFTPTVWATRAGLGGLIVALLLAAVGVAGVMEFGGAQGGLLGAKKDVAWIVLIASVVLGACSAGTMARVGFCALAQAVLFGLLGLMQLDGFPDVLVGLLFVAIAAASGLGYRQIRARAREIAEL